MGRKDPFPNPKKKELIKIRPQRKGRPIWKKALLFGKTLNPFNQE